MKMYLPFGDWSDDGHGKYEKVLIEAPSMEHLRNAQIEIEKIYGKDFWRGFAEEYEESTFSEEVQAALIDSNYPIERFAKFQDDCNIDNFDNLGEFFDSDYWIEDMAFHVILDLVVDAFIWLLNWKGAEITRSEEEIPMICNWTCRGFETVGYGCFW